MSVDEISKIADHLKEKGKMIFYEGVNDKQIQKCEKKNKIKIPIQYKEWLQYSDGGDCFLPAGIQLYGVSHKPIINTKYHTKSGEEFFAIGALANGDPILCQSSKENVSIYNREAGRIEADETFPSFFEFLNNLSDILGIGS